jgi:ketosteroid isomerase-like protein
MFTNNNTTIKTQKGEAMKNNSDQIELIEKVYKAFSKRDLEELSNLCSSNIRWEQNPGFPGGGINIGIDKIIENVYEANNKRWKNFNFERHSLTATQETVLVEGFYIVQGPKSSTQVKAETAHIFRLKDNKVISFKQYTDTKTLWNNFEEGNTNEN